MHVHIRTSACVRLLPSPLRDDGRVRHESRDRQEGVLADERGAGDPARPADGRPGPAGDGRLQRSRAAALRRRASGCGWRARRSGPTCRGTSPSSTSRRSTPSRFRAATSTSPAASCRSSTTRRSSPACSATRSATSRRATRRSSTRRRRAPGSASRCSASSCPRRGRSRACAETALGVLFLKHGRDDELQADRAGRATTPPRRAGIRPVSPACCARSRGSTRRAAAGAACRTGCRRIRRPPTASQQVQAYIAEGAAIAVGTSGTTERRAELPARVDGIIFGDSPSDGIVRGNHVPASGAAPRARRFRRMGGAATARTQVVAKAPEREQLHDPAARAERARLARADCAQARWPMPASGS